MPSIFPGTEILRRDGADVTAVRLLGVAKSLGHPIFIDVISKFGFIHYAWFMIGCLVYERMHGRDKGFHYAVVVVAMLINFSYYVKNAGALTSFLTAGHAFLYCHLFKTTGTFVIRSIFTAIGFASYAYYLIHAEKPHDCHTDKNECADQK
ncbi:hypothetical protein LZ023_39240 (plasmid) [Pseudomonas silvicola]|nr:hypothetical protein LZ023_39240 [Pseudomonas silvicola]